MKKYVWLKISSMFSFILLALGLSIMMTTIVSKEIYRLFIKVYDLPKLSGLTHDQLLETYQSMQKYLLLPSSNKLDLIYFSSSVQGIQHFMDVKQLYFYLLIVVVVVTISSLILGSKLRQRRQHRKMAVAFNIATILPIGFLFSLFLAFDRIFILFHEMFFQNDYWLFDPLTDPIITVLPETFFMTLFVIMIILYEIMISLIRIVISKK